MPSDGERVTQLFSLKHPTDSPNKKNISLQCIPFKKVVGKKKKKKAVGSMYVSGF